MNKLNLEQLRTVALIKKQLLTKTIEQLGNTDSSPLISSGRTILNKLSSYAGKKPLLTVTTAAVAGIIADRMFKQVSLISEDQILSAKSEIKGILERAVKRNALGMLKYTISVLSNVSKH